MGLRRDGNDLIGGVTFPQRVVGIRNELAEEIVEAGNITLGQVHG